jgi:SHS2 domain-containing protein
LILQIHANSLPQLFENTARELLKILVDPNEVGEVLREKVVVQAADTPSLLKEWVNTLLGLVSKQRILFKAYRFQEFEAENHGAGRLRAEITGELVDPLRHIFLKEPASLYCEQARVLNGPKSIEAEIILEPVQNGS